VVVPRPNDSDERTTHARFTFATAWVVNVKSVGRTFHVADDGRDIRAVCLPTRERSAKARLLERISVTVRRVLWCGVDI
jgi:hypothetical protein